MTTVIFLLILFSVAVWLLVRLVRTNKTNKTQADFTVQYTCNGPIYNGQLWKR